MKGDACSEATLYADRMSRCLTIIELRALGLEIKANLEDVAGWEQWLRDCYSSKAHSLAIPETRFEDTLNSAGKKALKKEGQNER